MRVHADQAQEVLTREQLNRVLPDLIPLYPSQGTITQILDGLGP